MLVFIFIFIHIQTRNLSRTGVRTSVRKRFLRTRGSPRYVGGALRAPRIASYRDSVRKGIREGDREECTVFVKCVRKGIRKRFLYI